MCKIRKAYVDSRFRTRDSNSGSDSKFELMEALGLLDNTVCYIDDISIPHTWRTIESHNNGFYINFKTMYSSGGGTGITEECNYNPQIFTLPEGNYTGRRMAAAIQELLNGFAVTFGFEVLFHSARGTVTIEAKSEGLGEHNKFHIPSDFGIMNWMNSTDRDYPWQNRQGLFTSVDNNILQSVNGVLMNSNSITVNLETEYYRSYEIGFIDLLNVQIVYLHCPNLGHFNSIGVRGVNTII